MELIYPAVLSKDIKEKLSINYVKQKVRNCILTICGSADFESEQWDVKQ